jgi:hypothetical protein
VNRGRVLIIRNDDNVRRTEGQAACQEKETLSRGVDEGESTTFDTQQSGRSLKSASIERRELVVAQELTAGAVDEVA